MQHEWTPSLPGRADTEGEGLSVCVQNASTLHLPYARRMYVRPGMGWDDKPACLTQQAREVWAMSQISDDLTFGWIMGIC